MSTSELATSYAALILADDGVDITVISPREQSHDHTNIDCAGRQTANTHQSRQCHRCGANMDISIRQGTEL